MTRKAGSELSLQLLPAPRHLELAGAGTPWPGTRAEIREDVSLPAQGYEIRVAQGAVRLSHADAAGLRYARSTLEQISRLCDGQVPGLLIRDWPDFPVRGYMLDVSRDRVPTRQTLERIVDLLALLRMNHLQLYTEHTFAYPDHEVVWRKASPLSADDVRWLDGLCHERGIELAANQNCFGHMERWLRHDAYNHLAETPDGFDTRFGRRPAATLAPDAASLALVRGLLEELLPHFSSRRVHIGCDETFELGLGRSRPAVAAHGRGRVYLEFLLQLLAEVHARGGEALFWGDILRHDPHLIAEIPHQDTVALVWHYEAPVDPERVPRALRGHLAELGVGEEVLMGFASQVPAFLGSGLPFWVCPGTSSWNTLVGRFDNARANLLDAAEVGRAAKAAGYLVTDWGDNGHLQPPSSSFLPLAYGAAVSWCQETNRDAKVAAWLDRWVFEDTAQRIGDALVSMGNAHRRVGLRVPNASPLFTSLVATRSQPAWGEATEPGLRDALECLARSADELAAARPACSDGDLVKRELTQALRLARHGTWRLARSLGFACPGDTELHQDLAACIEEQRHCWLARSRPGGLADSLARLEQPWADYR